MFIPLIALLICAIIFSGCGGGKGGNGGNGGSTSDYTLNLAVEPKAAGAVLLEPAGGKYAKGTEVTLTPAAEGGYEFREWTGPDGDQVIAKYDRWTIKMDGHKQIVASFNKLELNQVATPTASPLGGKVTVDTEITLATTTDGAIIYYTFDGTNPTTGSVSYSDAAKPRVPAGGMTLKAFAAKEGMLDSNIVTFVYSIIIETPGEESNHNVGGVDFSMRRAPGGLTFPFGMFDGTATINDDFWIGETEVTYELWEEVYTWATAEAREADRYHFPDNTGNAGSHYLGELTEPVTKVSWRDAIVWCNALTEYYNDEKEESWDCVYTSGGKILRDSRDENADAFDNVSVNSSAKGFRLPTSKEWELAARYINETDWLPYNHASGDLSGACYPTATTTRIGDYAWYAGNSLNDDKGMNTTHPVAETRSNALGLYDMSGNVWELCFDRHWSDANNRVIRGGYYGANTGTHFLLVSYENQALPHQADATLGFRIVRTD